MTTILQWCHALAFIIGLCLPFGMALPTLEITSSSVSACGDVHFNYHGGTPPYTFNAVVSATESDKLKPDGVSSYPDPQAQRYPWPGHLAVSL
jgi:hypothetical protein